MAGEPPASTPTASPLRGAVATLIRVIDAINDRVGRWSAWIALVLVVVTTADVAMRYLFNTSFVFVQELEWHLFAVMFLITAGYAHLLDSHVRVDIFYARMRPRVKAWVDFVCGIVFLFPTVFLLIWTSIPFVVSSARMLEGSPDPGGIPGRFILKAVIPLGFLLLGVQGISQVIKTGYLAFGKEVPR